jgi:hypothetical protein
MTRQYTDEHAKGEGGAECQDHILSLPEYNFHGVKYLEKLTAEHALSNLYRGESAAVRGFIQK